MTSLSHQNGSLIIVGTGIKLISHITVEAHVCIKKAEKVLFLLADVAADIWIKRLNINSESMDDCYIHGEPRYYAYDRMVERILSYVRKGLNVCVVFYGHPGVFVDPAHESIRRARMEGFSARMLPGISAEDCLFAELGIDPAENGCQSFEATDFLVYKRKFDNRSSLILWQIGVIGDPTFNKNGYKNSPLTILYNVLKQYYPPDHEVIIYEASPYSICDSIIQRIPLNKMSETIVSVMSTLYVPPKERSLTDKVMLDQLQKIIKE
jgi:uncharacterized protein YabN with tetrapyrrole methylase and pyrophosphatase domain